METRLLVDGREEGSLLAGVGEEGGAQVELEALGEVVLSLNLGTEDVGGGPRLGENEAVCLVGELGFELAANQVGLRVLGTGDLEGDVGGRCGFNLEGGAREGVVLAEQVVGRLAEILHACCGVSGLLSVACRATHLPGWGNGLGERHGLRGV